MKKSVIPLLIICTYFIPLHLMAEEVYKSFTAGRVDTYLETGYFKTVGNFGPSGEKQSLPVNSYLQNINLQTIVRYSLSNDLGIYSGINFNNVESFNGLNSRTNALMTHFILGGDYQIFHSEKWVLYADFSYYYSNVKVDLNQDEALGSDGADEYRAMAVGIFKLQKFKSFAKVGYDFRSDGLSSLLLYGFGAEFPIGYSAIGAELNGSSTVKDDQNTNTPLIRDTLTDRVNARSRIFYSINPNILDAKLYYSYLFTPNLLIKINAGSTVLGSNSADGYHAGISLNWGFGSGESFGAYLKNPKKFIKNSTAISDDDPGFKIDTNDGINQDLFKQVEPPKPKK